jgi:3-dehydroquinate synthase
MEPTLQVRTPRLESTSPIWIGRNLIASLRSILESLPAATQVVIVSEAGASHVASRAQEALDLQSDAMYELEGGEGCKSLQHLEDLWQFFLRRKLDRKSLVLAIGGGASTDLVGFACATFMRGICYVPVPTTLLAQVDAGIGGKTAINYGGVKNLVGTITPPTAIVNDIDVLATLPERQLHSGFAEIAKHGLIVDASYFHHVTSRHCSAWSHDELVDIVVRSVEIKRRIVELDETESGPRKSLNFGHTIGHAIEEAQMGMADALSHGEAVSVGIHAEAFLSCKTGRLSHAELDQIACALRVVGLPTHLSQPIAPSTLIKCMADDKKNIGGKNRWSLLSRIGQYEVDCEIPQDLVSEAVDLIQPQRDSRTATH